MLVEDYKNREICYIACKSIVVNSLEMLFVRLVYTPNANMADHSVVARDESHESEASQSDVLFDSTSSGKSCFVVDLMYFVLPSIKFFVFVNATRTEQHFPQ